MTESMSLPERIAQTVGGKPLREHLEATGHRDALPYVRPLASVSEPVREGDIRNIHRIVLQRIDPEEAGRYSNHQRLISGSSLLLPSPAEIPARMGDLQGGSKTFSPCRKPPSMRTKFL